MKAVDLFAGFGGFTLGAELAGLEVVWAANHWRLAVDTHAANHPDTEHSCQDLRQADWTALPNYDVLLASPSCKGHSTASRGHRRAYHENLRSTAWAVLDCAEDTRPATVLVENVPAFLQWDLFDLWLEAFRRLGYAVELRRYLATGYDVPQRRQRVLICASRVGHRLPAPREVIQEPAIGPCLEDDAPGWRPWSKRSAAARRRMTKGRRNHGRTFLSQEVTGHPGVPLHEPIRTLTTKDQWWLVDGDRCRPLTLRELARAMSFPDSFQLPEVERGRVTRGEVIQGLGNAVPPRMAGQLIAEVVA